MFIRKPNNNKNIISGLMITLIDSIGANLSDFILALVLGNVREKKPSIKAVIQENIRVS